MNQPHERQRAIDLATLSQAPSYQATERVVQNFQRAKRRARTEEMLASIRRLPIDLLAFDQVQARLKLSHKVYQGLQDVPLNKIVGSVNRSDDFTRTFMPRKDSIQPRWQQVDRLMNEQGFPPIELYQVSHIYFVRDGHHRVSVAQQEGLETIEAHVWAYESRVPLWADDTSHDIDIRGEYVEFLERTQLDKFRPTPPIIFMELGCYWALEEEMAIHRYYLGLEQGRDPTFQEAMLDWHDKVYMPLVKAILEDELLTYYPGRTVADLALHIIKHQYWLEGQSQEEEISMAEATEDFAERLRRSPWRRLQSWVAHRILGQPIYWPGENN